ncbi:MAG: porin [Candidatus Binatia bacterium]
MGRPQFGILAVVLGVGLGLPQFVLADEKALQKALADKKALEEKVEDLDQKVHLLEQRLEQILSITGGAKTLPASVAHEEQVQVLDQKVRILERRWELEQEQAAAKTKEAPIFTAGREGFSLRAADGSYQLKIRGYLQGDGRFFADDQERALTDTFLLRRVRPILEGTVGKYFDFRIMTDFGGGSASVQDAYIDTHFWPSAQLRVGKYKAPVGLERLQSGSSLLFVERGLPANLVPNRDVGAQVHGDLFEGVFNYALGTCNGVPDGGSGDVDVNDSKEFAGRVFVLPFKRSSIVALQGVGLGLAGTYGDQSGSASSPNLPSFRTPGQQTFFRYRSDGTAAGTTIANGIHSRFAPQGYYYYGPFGLFGEYVKSYQRVQRDAEHEMLDNEAWQMAVSYVLTGENASYRSVVPATDFDLRKGTWGAFEVAARYGELHVDIDAFPFFADPTKAARVAESWGLGLTWYWNRNVKFQLNYEQTDFTGGSATGERPKERAVLSRFQLSF